MAAVIIRTVIMYTALLGALRLSGKRQLGELELSEFVMAALAADMASHPLQDVGIPLINGLIPVLVLFSIELISAGLAFKSPGFRAFLRGKPSILVRKGRICQSELRKNRLSMDELTEQLREKGCLDIAECEYAVLETGGNLSLILFPGRRPVTADDIGLPPGDGGYPREIISCGRLNRKNLRGLGLSEKWLYKKLSELGHPDINDYFYLSANESRRVYYALREGLK